MQAHGRQLPPLVVAALEPGWLGMADEARSEYGEVDEIVGSTRPGQEFDPHTLPFLVDPQDGSSLSPSPLLQVPASGTGAMTLTLHGFAEGASGFIGPNMGCEPAEGADATVATIPIHAAGD